MPLAGLSVVNPEDSCFFCVSATGWLSLARTLAHFLKRLWLAKCFIIFAFAGLALLCVAVSGKHRRGRQVSHSLAISLLFFPATAAFAWLVDRCYLLRVKARPIGY